MWCVVLRSFSGDNPRPFQAGEIVKADGWRTLNKLVEQRYVRPATVEEIALAETPVDLPPPVRRKTRAAA